MLRRDMLSTHGLIVGGTAKQRSDAVNDIQLGFVGIGVAAMHQDANALIALLSNLIDKLPDQEDPEKPGFAIFCEDAKKLFGENAKYEGFEIEAILQKSLEKGIRVYFSSTRLSDFPDYILDEFDTKIDATDKDGDGYPEIYSNAAALAEFEAPSVALTKTKAAELAEQAERKNAKAEKSAAEKAIERSKNSAITSATRSISTNIVNGLTGKKVKSAKDVASQVATTALSTFLRNIVKESMKSK